MIQVGIDQATDELADLIDKALDGEQVDIVKGSTAKVRLQPIRFPEHIRRIGGAPSLVIAMADDFNAPLADFADYM